MIQPSHLVSSGKCNDTYIAMHQPSAQEKALLHCGALTIDDVFLSKKKKKLN